MLYRLQNNNINLSRTRDGMTLIEILIYVALLSVLLSGFFSYLYNLNDSEMSIYNQVHETYDE